MFLLTSMDFILELLMKPLQKLLLFYIRKNNENKTITRSLTDIVLDSHSISFSSLIYKTDKDYITT